MIQAGAVRVVGGEDRSFCVWWELSSRSEMGQSWCVVGSVSNLWEDGGRRSWSVVGSQQPKQLRFGERLGNVENIVVIELGEEEVAGRRQGEEEGEISERLGEKERQTQQWRRGGGRMSW